MVFLQMFSNIITQRGEKSKKKSEMLYTSLQNVDLFLFAIFYYIRNAAIQRRTDFVKNIAIISYNLILVIIVDNMKTYAGALGKLVSCDFCIVNIFFYGKFNHTITSLRYIF